MKRSGPGRIKATVIKVNSLSQWSRTLAVLFIGCCLAGPGRAQPAPAALAAAAEQEVRYLTSQLRDDPQQAKIWHARGLARLKLADAAGAGADFSEAIRLAPFNAEFRTSRARLGCAEAHWAEAIADATDGLANDTNRADLYVLRALARRSLGLLDLAVADCNQALALKPNNPEALVERAWAGSLQTNWTGVLDDATAANRLAPDRLDAVVLQGIARRERHEWPEAVERFTEAIRLDGTSLLAYFNRGRAETEMGSWVPAFNDLSAAIRLNPGLAEAYVQRGRVRTEQGDFAGAINDL